MRQSVAPNRASQAPNAAALAKLMEKKKEYEAVCALENASASYVQRIEALAIDFDVMANGGEVFGQVLEQWPAMFQILSHFLNGKVESDTAGEPLEIALEPDMLVRIPIEELQPAKSDS